MNKGHVVKVKYQVLRGCTFCNTCIFECPVNAITMTNEGARINLEKCTGCGTCYDNCASEAIVAVEADG